ncbi:hypothetical protein ACFYXF_34680 [Streptomyces sp. NPDC002680]|uniref:hypothetical protein n=1 Tax=Streptomyces sp. NPDC002680 TaxID=3364659 RepID=UPI0036952430
MEKIVVQLAPSALHGTAETLTGYLGVDIWQVNGLILDGIISLEGPHERQIGMRLLGDGSSIQLWATGGTVPADHEPTEGTIPLSRGHRWHTPVHIGALEADKDPGVVLYNTITDRLLPVFDTKPLYVGHRPWDPPAEPEAADATTPADSIEIDQPAAEPESQAPAATETAKQTRHLKAVPAPADQPTAEQPKTEATHVPELKPAPKRTRRPKPSAPVADGESKARPTRKRTAPKPAAAAAEGEPKPRTARKPQTTAKPAPDKPSVS